jgi:hypothetical protein
MSSKNSDADRGDGAGLLIALEAFQKARQGAITPSELGGVLRELTTDIGPAAKPKAAEEKLMMELREFVELDLSDYAYSLAIHDSRAIDKFKDRIGEWADRLQKEAARKNKEKN